MKQVFTTHFSSDCRRKYKEVPFTVPEGMHGMTIAYAYDKKKKKLPGIQKEDSNAVDLCLASPEQYIGSSGCSRDEIYISEIYSTPGYKKTPIIPGEWKLLFGFNKIKEAGCDIEVTITYEEKEARFYRGDCHTHTVHSDGHTKMENIIKKAKKNNIDFFICTDHNTDTACAIYPSARNMCIMPGLELTCYMGHFNLLCAEKPLDVGGFKFESVEELKQRLEYAKGRGALLSMNHPHCKNCGWHLPFEGFDYDIVEVWNAIMRIDNETTIQWWHKELLKGNRKVAVGGSDFHADYVVTDLFAMPCTVVYATDNAPKEIKEGLSKGHCYITHKPDTSEMILTCKDKMMGDTITWEEGMKAHLHVTKLRRGYTLRIFNNDNILLERKGKGEKVIELDFEVPEKGFVRAEITHKLNAIGKLGFRLAMVFSLPQDVHADIPDFHWALTNPIFFE